MTKFGDMIPKGQSRKDRPVATNAVQLKNGTYPAKIVDVWVFNVDEKGKYTKDKTDQYKVEIKFEVAIGGGATHVLAKRMRAFISEKARFAKLLESLTGITAGSDEMRDLDANCIKDMSVYVELKYDGAKYTNVENVFPVPQNQSQHAPADKPEKLPGNSPITYDAGNAIQDKAKKLNLSNSELVEVIYATVGKDGLGKCNMGDARAVMQALIDKENARR